VSDGIHRESGVMALAITPQGDFGDLPNCGKASNRGTRPWLGPVLIAGKKSLPTSGGIIRVDLPNFNN